MNLDGKLSLFSLSRLAQPQLAGSHYGTRPRWPKGVRTFAGCWFVTATQTISPQRGLRRTVETMKLEVKLDVDVLALQQDDEVTS